MTQAAPAAWPAEGAWLLKPSISYALRAVLAVTPELLSRPTPCRGWDLRMLLRHASESVAAISEGIEAGRVGLDPAAEDRDLAADP
ncbi:MAG TPA: maleylpyruvate isomerase N-terminal domain-containing protein, partial [Streptosporangiaceae bacterium]